MKERCTCCQTGKAKRECRLKGNSNICPRCCAEMRGAPCGECPHYAEALRYQSGRWQAGNLPDEHFIAEINPEVQQAVDDALALADKGMKKDAMKAMNELARDNADIHDVCYGMGTLCAMGGNPWEAIEWLKKAVAILPYFPEAHLNMGVAYQQLLDVGKAIRAFRKAMEYGDPAEEFYGKARSFIDDMAEVIQQNDGVDLDTYVKSDLEFGKAFALMEQGDWKGALAGFRTCAGLHARHAPTQGNMALCLANLGRKADALAALDRALEVDPEYEPAMTNRLLVNRMEEGQPLKKVGFKAIEYSLDKFKHRKRNAAS
jgi:tetratricopeptide (TPR) repeat protein